MKKNKMIALSLIGLMLICANSICADSKSTEVKYQVEEAYEWSIHPEINFGKNAGSRGILQKREITFSPFLQMHIMQKT